MSVSLFRRWRSQKFSDLVGQEAVVSTLQNVLRSGDPARAYLFCGPRGTGKTSSARIFAKALNCEKGPAEEPCNECSQCRSIADGSNLDVFEIDAASHTQVDKIRDFIVEKVHFTPVVARYKVYIIDEVHKLSTSSFNALLKTLEEPPSHVVFVLATTHPHEIPATILSRCQRYDFRPLTATETERHLTEIAKVEEIELDEDAARQLARAADGSLRDALVLFEQAHVFSEGRVTRDKVLDLLGGVGYEVLEEMFTDLHRGEAASALQRLDEWIVRGRDLKRLAESFQDHLRMLLLLKVRSEDQSIRHLSSEERASLERLTQLLSVGAITQWLRGAGEMLAQIRYGRRARLEWEQFLVSLAHPEVDPSLESLERRLERIESGAPVARAEHAPATSLPADLTARLEKLERGSSAAPDDGRLAALEKQLAQLTHSFDARLEELEERLNNPDMASSAANTELRPAAGHGTGELSRQAGRECEPSGPKVGGREGSDPLQPQSRKMPTSQPDLPPAEPVVGLERDQVDDWFDMPAVLVTGRIDCGGQTSLLDSLVDRETEEPGTGEPGTKEPGTGEPGTKEPGTGEPGTKEPARPPDLATAVSQVSASGGPVVAERDKARANLDPTASIEGSGPTEPQTLLAQEVVPKEGAVSTAPEVASMGATAIVELPDPKEFFRLLMQQVKENDIRLHAVLADARLAALRVDFFELAVPAGYDWHFGKIQEGKGLLESLARKIIPGCSLQLECSIGGEKAAPPKENEHEELVKRASGVFSGSSIVD